MKKGRFKRKLITVSLVLVIAFAIYYYNVAYPIMLKYAKSQTEKLIEKSVNVAVNNVVNQTLKYDSLINISYSDKGEIATFSANQYEINTITREIVKETEYQITNVYGDDLIINIGTLTGIPYLLGKGPGINFKILPISAVGGDFESAFSSVGINMTKHTLMLSIKVEVNLILPLKSYNFTSKTQVLLAESIIVGKVPEVYLNGESIRKTLNLLP